MVSNWGWQDHERRRKITDLTIFFKIKTGNVPISFPNDLREVDCPYRLTAPSQPQHQFQFQRCSSFVNAHKHAFFVRNVPAWNALFPASVCADSVAAFHSSICNNFMYWRFFFIWLVILFVFTYSFVFILFIYFAVNVMSFRVLTVHCQISSLVAIMSIKEKEKKKNGLQIMVW